MSTRWEACGKESEDHMAGHGMRRKRRQEKKRKNNIQYCIRLSYCGCGCRADAIENSDSRENKSSAIADAGDAMI